MTQATLAIENASVQLAELIRLLGPSDEILITDNQRLVARIIPGGSCPSLRLSDFFSCRLPNAAGDEESVEDRKSCLP